MLEKDGPAPGLTPEQVSKRDAAFLRMKEVAREMGVTPLTREEFIREDRRILLEWERRRRGLPDKALLPSPFVRKHPCITFVPVPAPKSWWKRLALWLGAFPR